MAHLKELQEKYVLVPADKAGNNIIFVYKYYYMHTLMEELGINSGSTINSTYEKQDITVDEIIRTHTRHDLRKYIPHHLTTEKFAKNILDTKTSQDTVQSTFYCRFKFMHHY